MTNNYHNASKISFVIFMFIVFFGTSLPFQPQLQERELGDGNILNQILYPSLFLISLFASVPKIKIVTELLKREKLLIIFLLWALLSILWSDYAFTSFKRWFQIFTYFFVIIVFLSYIKTIDELLSTLKPLVFLYVMLSLVSVVLIPGAKDPDFGTFRGLAPHKNYFGQTMLMIILLLSTMFIYEKKRISKIILMLLLFISVILLIGAASSTSLISFLFFFFASIIFLMHNYIFKHIGVTWFLSTIIVLSGISILAVLLLFSPEILDFFTGLFGKDTTFSQRSFLWEYTIMEISKHPLVGCGYQGYWVPENPSIQILYAVFIWIPIQSHNGFLDIANELGIIGIIVLIIMIINFFIRIFKKKEPLIWMWFPILIIILNFQETTLFRPGHISTTFFMLSYLISFSDLRSNNSK